MLLKTACALLWGTLLFAQPALAGSISFAFTSGSRSASVEFTRSGSDLLVELTNTSLADVLVPTDVLTAVFFQVDGDPALTRVSALVPAGNSVLVGGSGSDVTPSGGVVGGEWAYANGISNPAGFNEGISSTGLSDFGSGNLFPGDNLQGPASPDGLQYGITSAGDDLSTGNGGVSGQNLIKNSVVFTLAGFSGEPDALITAARFLYGTSLSEPQFNGTPSIIVPEPSVFVLALSGIAAALVWRRRYTGK